MNDALMDHPMPNADSAAAAVTTLRAELEMVDGALESIDRKAALIPAVLGTIAGIFLGPAHTYGVVEQTFLVLALVTGIVAVFVALRVIHAQNFNVGPDAAKVAAGTHLDPADFNQAVAGSLAIAVAALAALSVVKSRGLNFAMTFAATSILFLALARVAGG